jgi:cell division protein FtsB
MGVGIAPVANNLHVVVSSLRPSGVRVLGETWIQNYTERPSAEWGRELADFLQRFGAGHVPAVVVLPRKAVTVRVLGLPGVAPQDMGAAVAFQADSLHPYDEAEAIWSWGPVADAAPGEVPPNNVLVGISTNGVVEGFSARFAEAGVKLGSVSFSAAAFYTAARFFRSPEPAGVFAVIPSRAEGMAGELYGESPVRPVFSSAFDGGERMVAMARSDLRLPADAELVSVQRLLPAPLSAPADFDLSASATPYAASILSAAPRFSLESNLLPPELRMGKSALAYAPTLALASLLVIAVVMLAGQNSYQDRKYLEQLNAEIATIEKRAQRAQELDAEAAQLRARIELLDQFKRRSAADAEALKEITDLVAAPGWVGQMSMGRTEVSLAGESDQAASLVETFDKSPLFVNASLGLVSGQAFQLKVSREGPGTGEPPADKQGSAQK